MKKILSLFAICMMAVTSAWADDVTEVKSQDELQTVATNGGSCKLVADIDLTKSIILGTTTTTTVTLDLDLNGHVLNGKGIPAPTAAGDYGCILSTKTGGLGGKAHCLHITDSNPNADHSDWNTAHPTSEGNSDLSNIKGAVLTGGKGVRLYPTDNTYGGAIWSQSGELTVKGVTFIGNTATYGGAIHVEGNTYYGSPLLDGTTIINNSATSYGAIYFSGECPIILKDCTITGNTTTGSSDFSSHTYFGNYNPCVVGGSNNGNIILKGKNNITGNTACGKTGNLCFVSFSDDDTTFPGSIKLDDTFDNESTIGINRIVGAATSEKMSGFPPYTIYDFAFGSGQFTTNGSAANAAAFIPDDSETYGIKFVDDHLETYKLPDAWEIGENKYATIKEAMEAVTEGQTIQMTRDIDLTSTITVPENKTVTLDLNGHVLNAGNLAAPTTEGAKANVIYNEGTLTIIDSNPTNVHTDWNTSHQTSAGNADLSAVTGGVLTGGKGYCYTTDFVVGGAIYQGKGEQAQTGGTLTMTGGTITGNTASESGGGIYVGYGALTLNGTKITNNTVHSYGGGISTSGNPTVDLYDCTITGNKAKFCGGLEVFQNITIGGKVVIKDNYLSDGTTKNNAGVYDGGTFTISSTKPLTTDSEIGIFTFSGENVAAAAKFTTNGSATDAAYFTSDDSYYEVKYNADGYLETVAKSTAINDVDANTSTSSAQAQGKFIEDGRLVIVKDSKKYNTAGQMVK